MSEGDVGPPKMVVAEAHNIGEYDYMRRTVFPNPRAQIPTMSPINCSSEFSRRPDVAVIMTDPS